MPIRYSSVVGGSGVPSGATSDRPENPTIGDQFYNGTVGSLEIYTESGWISSASSSEFNLSITGSITSVVLDKEYLAGDYTITSSASDTSLDIYLFNSLDEAAGNASSLAVTATKSFNKVVIYGGTVGDVLTFVFKSTFPTSESTTDTFAAPYVTSLTPSDLPDLDNTVTISGGNFDTDMQVWFDGQNDYSEQAKSVVYGSPTSIVATRPDNLVEDDSPYTIRLVNPGTPSPTSTNVNKLIDSITAGGDPVWVTDAGALTQSDYDQAYSETLQATDPDGSTISYSVVSGQLPAGLTLNPSTGEISGTPTNSLGENPSFIIAASDPSGNTTNRSFTLRVYSPPQPIIATGGSVTDRVFNGRSYRVHTFTSTGDTAFQVTSLGNIDNNTLDCLIVGGGGGGGTSESGTTAGDGGGGGGAGGVLVSTGVSVSVNSYVVTVGNGGSGMSNGQNSSFNGLIAFGGGRGGTDAGTNNTAGDNVGIAGGSGGGAASVCGSLASGGAGTPGQGNDGGYAQGCEDRHGAGGGGAGAVGGNGNTYGNGDGGTGIANNYRLGSDQYYGGGGGGGAGGASQNRGAGGNGGGANGGTLGAAGENAADNTGGGGGGTAAGSGSNGGSGGSGIVVIRYPLMY